MTYRGHKGAALRDAKLLELITKCAREGHVAPTNVELAEHLGIDAPSTAYKALRRLEARGAIVVQRFASCRVITIASTGKRTASPMPPAHRQHADKAARADDQPQADDSSTVLARSEPPRLDRDPCRLCGVRGDIGCRHSRRGARPYLFVPSHLRFHEASNV